MSTGEISILSGSGTCNASASGLGAINSAEFGEAYAIFYDPSFGLFLSDGLSWKETAIKLIH